MYDIITEYEHCTIHNVSESELVALWNDCPKLIESIDPKTNSYKTGYFIGIQWLANTEKALFVKPKLDKFSRQTDFLRMLNYCLNLPEVHSLPDKLFHIEFEKSKIEIPHEDDYLTPLIIVQFLSILRLIVKNGLKKGYYRINSNRNSNVKGKILVAKNVKHNLLNNRFLHTFCSYDEFGINTPQNRLIKRALEFASTFVKVSMDWNTDLTSALNFICPAFEEVSLEHDSYRVPYLDNNPFYKTYNKAIELANLILKRFGYNINSIDKSSKRLTPPFWIDMSKLFEMYVLGRLRCSLELVDIRFQSKGHYGYLDFLYTAQGKELLIDAKYKLAYKVGCYNIEDIRQISAYARDVGILSQFNPLNDINNSVPKCLIIYPDDNDTQNIDVDLSLEMLLKNPIIQFNNFFKFGISVPTK